MYHFFYDESAGEEGKDNNFMEISSFENQMKYLSANANNLFTYHPNCAILSFGVLALFGECLFPHCHYIRNTLKSQYFKGLERFL